MNRLIRLGVGEAWKLGRFLFDFATMHRYYTGFEDGHRAGVAFTQREMERTK